ncbi:MAG: SDR family oxidoreductase, partial [Gammaproteobacteria bacterium]|nr:SDR family oxidoreductase [Gammaproteobacteria bacterium]
VTIVVGDLAKSLLGLDQATFDLLSEEVDYIYHCGAYVHHIYNYETLRNSNVLSTLEILKLAISKKNKQIHYVSTLSTTVNYPNDNGFVVEDFFYEAKLPLEGLSGYVQTKLASEILLAKAYQRGVQVFIYRPSWIVGSKDTGVCSMENNHLFLLLKGCMQVGYAPKLKVNLNMFPVDFVSELIVRISLNGDKIKQRVFNMVNPYDVSWSSLFKCINSFGYKVKMVSALNWGQKHLEKIDKDNAIYPLVSLYHADGGVNWAVSQSGFSNIGNDNTKTAMKIFDLNDVKIDDTTLRCYFEQLRQDDFMPSIDMGDAFDYEKL